MLTLDVGAPEVRGAGGACPIPRQRATPANAAEPRPSCRNPSPPAETQAAAETLHLTHPQPELNPPS
eukprot:5382504-Prymnesium_polylepis.1